MHKLRNVVSKSVDLFFVTVFFYFESVNNPYNNSSFYDFVSKFFSISDQHFGSRRNL